MPNFKTQNFSKCPYMISVLKSILIRNRELVLELARREIADRYVGSILGLSWSFITPLLTLSIYVGLFGFIFPTRMGNNDSPWIGATLILSGLIPWISVSDILIKSTSVLLSHRSFVRQVVFPVEVLPAKCVIVSFFNQIICTIALLLIAHYSVGLSIMLLLLPLLLLFQLTLMLGAVLILSALGVWFRDLREIITFLVSIGLYLAPILLLPKVIDSLPAFAKFTINLNPFSHMVWCFHDVIVLQKIDHPISWIIFPIFSLILLFIGANIFTKFKHLFGEAL